MRSANAIVLTFMLSLGAAISAGESKVYCLVVGVEEYPNGNLVGCAHDAQSMETHLKNQFGPARTQVVRISDVPKDDTTVTAALIKQAIDKIKPRVGPDDYFYFYYSGHGGDGALVLPNENWNAQDLATALAGVQSKLTVAIFDSCHSGSLLDPIKKARGDKDLIFVAAVESKQTAKTCLVGGNVCPANTTDGSVFTRWLIVEMKNMENDKNRDGIVSWREAEDAAKKQISSKTYLRGYLPNVPVPIGMTPVFFQQLKPPAAP